MKDAGTSTPSRPAVTPRASCIPYALDLLRKMNFDVTRFRSKSWNEFTGADAPKLDFAFTLCDDAAAEACPVWPGQPMTAHWGLPDPAAATGNEAERRFAFADTFRMLNNRISIFVSLPIELPRQAVAATAARCDRQNQRRGRQARIGSRMNDTSSFLHGWRACCSRDPGAIAPLATFIDRATAMLLQDDRV